MPSFGAHTVTGMYMKNETKNDKTDVATFYVRIGGALHDAGTITADVALATTGDVLSNHAQTFAQVVHTDTDRDVLSTNAQTAQSAVGAYKRGASSKARLHAIAIRVRRAVGGIAAVVSTAAVLAACGTGGALEAQTIPPPPPSTAPQATSDPGEACGITTNTRDYILDGPAHVSAKRHPLVINIHGATGTAKAQREVSGMAPKAQEGAYVLLSVNAANTMTHVWDISDDGPDLNYIVKLIQEATGPGGCADPKKVFIVGFSQGGMIGSQLACHHPELISGVASISGTVPTEGCKPSTGVEFLSMHAKDDQVVRFDGGLAFPVVKAIGPDYVSSLNREALAAQIGARNGHPDAVSRKDGNTTVRDYGEGQNGAVRSITLDRGGHTWPAQAASEIDSFLHL